MDGQLALEKKSMNIVNLFGLNHSNIYKNMYFFNVNTQKGLNYKYMLPLQSTKPVCNL